MRNLKAVKEDGKWILYSVKLADSQLTSQDVYEVDDSIIRKLPSQSIYINTYILKSDNQLYDTSYKHTMENSEMVKTKNNFLIINYNYDNLWLINNESGEGKPFLATTGLDEAKKNCSIF